MIDWEATVKELGFKTERQMWKVLLASLRNSEEIAKYLGVSRGAVQRRRTLLNMHKASRRGGVYRKAGKRAVLEKIPRELWDELTISEIKKYVEENFDTTVSTTYISSYRSEIV